MLFQTLYFLFCKLTVSIRWVSLAFLLTSNTTAYAAEVLRIGGSGADLATIKQLSDRFMKTNISVTVKVLPSLGSSGAVKALVAGELEIGLSSRPFKPRELKYGLRALHYANTALVFAVKQNNPVNKITLNQLAAIYSSNRQQLNNNDIVRTVLRPKSDSDTKLLVSVYPNLKSHIYSAYRFKGIPIAVSDQIAADLITSIPQAIGTSSLALILAEKRPLKALALNDVMPSVNNIANGSYKLVKKLYIIVPQKTSPTVGKFLQFLRTPESITLLELTGHQVIPYSLPGT